jgi:hypothetical protein
MVQRTALRVVLIAVGTFLVGIAGALVGIWRLDLTIGVVLRTVLAIALLLAMTSAFRVSDRRAADSERRPGQQVLVAAGLAYALNLSSWGGRTLIGQMFFPAGVASALVDFLVWMVVAVVGVRLGDRARIRPTSVPMPYV